METLQSLLDLNGSCVDAWPSKVEAILAALRADLLDVLITDIVTAEALLKPTARAKRRA